MQKLQLSFKFLIQIPRNSSLQSHLCKNTIFSHTQTTQNQFYSSLTQPHSFSHHCFSSSRPWRSHHTLSQKISGVFGNPRALKQLARNTHLKTHSRSFFRDGAVLFRRDPSEIYSLADGFFRARRLGRSWFTTDKVILGLIGANVAVFMLWRYADPVFMWKNFMISVDNFLSGRVHTLITSAFSHTDPMHLFSNMLGLYFFGTSIGRTFGPQFLLKLYLAGAVGGSISFLLYHGLQRRRLTGMFEYKNPWAVSGLGASGAVNAIILLDIFLNPTAILYLEFFIPVPAALAGAFLIGQDIWRMMKKDSQISGAAHMGGALVAALAWARIRKRWI